MLGVMSDEQVDLVLTLEEVMTGCTREITLRTEGPCYSCSGNGYTYDGECGLCSGGIRYGTETRRVEIPAGAESGLLVGEAQVYLSILPHRLFTR